MDKKPRGGGSEAAADRTLTDRFSSLWTVRETADFLRCTDRHLRDLRDRGELIPVVRSAGKVLYFPGDVLVYANLTMAQALALAGKFDTAVSAVEKVAA